MFELLELPKEDPKELEQFTPLEEVKQEEPTETNEVVSKQDYDNLVKTIEELKNLISNKE